MFLGLRSPFRDVKETELGDKRFSQRLTRNERHVVVSRIIWIQFAEKVAINLISFFCGRINP
jgi:hypothetical protein